MRKALQNQLNGETKEKYRIIAVDDEDGVIESLSVFLKRTDYEFVGITDPMEAIEVVKREHFDLVTARAVKDLSILNELAIPYVKVNGLFIAMKSDVETELNNSLKGITTLGAKYIETKNINLPNNSGIRNFVIIKKESITNPKYPRQYNQIIKKTL